MGKSNYLYYYLACTFLYLGLSLISTPITAQDWRFSAGYSLQNSGFNYVPNSSYIGEVNASAKGLIEVELERYLFYRFYLAGKAEYLIHEQKDFFIGGPVNYEQFKLGAVAGLQWPKWGVYGGLKAGMLWDINIRATNVDGDLFWVPPTGSSSSFNTAFTGGVKYYLLNFLRLQFEITKSYGLPQGLQPEVTLPRSPAGTRNPAFQEFDFQPISFSLGFSISIPWNKRAIPKNGRDVDLPPLMRISGVNFASPLENTFVTSKFGPRWNSTHEGVDLDANMRDKIYAAEKGIVVEAGKGNGYGKMVRIKHARGYETIYAHMSRIRVKEGDRVSKGQLVGKAGNTGTSTGVHLHFEILKDGQPVNPLSYLRFD